VSSAGEGAVTTLAVLITGAQRLQFEDQEVLLSKEGDYALWHPHLAHKTIAVQDSIILVIR